MAKCIIAHHRGKLGKLSSISYFMVVAVFPINALNLFSKLYSGLAFPTITHSLK